MSTAAVHTAAISGGDPRFREMTPFPGHWYGARVLDSDGGQWVYGCDSHIIMGAVEVLVPSKHVAYEYYNPYNATQYLLVIAADSNGWPSKVIEMHELEGFSGSDTMEVELDKVLPIGRVFFAVTVIDSYFGVMGAESYNGYAVPHIGAWPSLGEDAYTAVETAYQYGSADIMHVTTLGGTDYVTLNSVEDIPSVITPGIVNYSSSTPIFLVKAMA